VHVYKDGKLIVKWNLDDKVEMKGKITNRILKAINTLDEQGKI